MARDYAYKLIGSSQVMDNLKNVNNCLQKPQTESQARPLTRLPAPLQIEAWEKVVDTATAFPASAFSGTTSECSIFGTFDFFDFGFSLWF